MTYYPCAGPRLVESSQRPEVFTRDSREETVVKPTSATASYAAAPEWQLPGRTLMRTPTHPRELPDLPYAHGGMASLTESAPSSVTFTGGHLRRARQIDARTAGCRKIFADKKSGTHSLHAQQEACGHLPLGRSCRRRPHPHDRVHGRTRSAVRERLPHRHAHRLRRWSAWAACSSSVARCPTSLQTSQVRPDRLVGTLGWCCGKRVS